jgi:hypothetical protein
MMSVLAVHRLNHMEFAIYPTASVRGAVRQNA